MRIKICGKYFDLQFCRIIPELPDQKATDNGVCDGPHIKNKKIRINKKLRGPALLNALIHEMLHGGDWQKDEEWVEEMANDIERVLTKLGYRKME